MQGFDRQHLAFILLSLTSHGLVLGSLALKDTAPHQVELPSAEPHGMVVTLVRPDQAFVQEHGPSSRDPRPVQRLPKPASDRISGPVVDPASPAQAQAKPNRIDGATAADAIPTPGSADVAPDSRLSAYQRLLNEAIARHSRYPAQARQLNLAGVTALAFRIDRGGRVLDSWIEDSSGTKLLDDAALEALDRAQPLPPIPPGLPDELDFVVLIDASLVRRLAVQRDL